MNTDRIIFSQVMDFIPKHHFNQCVRHYRANYRTRTFSCFDQFLCMAFAQLSRHYADKHRSLTLFGCATSG